MSYFPKITQPELASVVRDYAGELNGWFVWKRASLCRNEFPLQQMVWFQKLRTGAYRPMHAMNAIPYPMTGALSGILDVRHREATIKQHPSRWRGMLTAMEEQFQPAIRKPIDLEEVVMLCKAEADAVGEGRDNYAPHQHTMLAILCSWLGRKAEALDYCERIYNRGPFAAEPITDWELDIQNFCRELTKTLHAGTEKAFLEQCALNAAK